MTTTGRITTLVLFLFVAAAPGFAADTATPYDADAAFEALKTLEGEWVSQSSSGTTSEVLFEVTAAGSALIKTFSPGTPNEMVTVYHLDGSDLLLTHYCAVGNQPKMRFVESESLSEIRFEFAGGTNMDPAVDAHAHEGWTRIVDGDTIETESIGYSRGKALKPRRSQLQRQD